MDVITFPENLLTTSALSILLHGSFLSQVVMDATMAPAIFKPEKNLVFFRIKSRVP